MKILVIQDRLRSGGTERQSILLANAFAHAGHDTTLLTHRPGGRLRATVDPGVRQETLQRFDTRLDWFAPGLGRALERLQPAVVLLMGRMANCHGQLIVRETRDRRPHIAVIATMRTGKPLPWLFRFSLRRVRHVIANSQEARDTLVRTYRVPPPKISVIHNALVFSGAAEPAPLAPRMTPAGTADARSLLRLRHGATPATTVLLCVAMFRPEKNQRELIEIAAGLPPDADWQLWLAGEGPARAACERLAVERRIDNHVRFLGFQPDPTPLLAAADVAVHASWSEGLSNFIIEAQAHGRPAIVYDAQGMRECFLPARTGWAIPRDDRPAFRQALAQLMAEPAPLRAARAAEARAHALASFDAQRQVAAHLDLFQQLIGSPAP